MGDRFKVAMTAVASNPEHQTDPRLIEVPPFVAPGNGKDAWQFLFVPRRSDPLSAWRQRWNRSWNVAAGSMCTRRAWSPVCSSAHRTRGRGRRSAPLAPAAGDRQHQARESTAQNVQRIGTTAQNVQRIERGERNPTVTTLIRIADALDLELVVELRDTHGKVP